MARNRHAVIWTRLSGSPEKMGDLVLDGEQAAFTYTQEYLASGRPGFCLLGDGAIWGTDSITYPVSERIPVFPRLLSLVPGNNPRNLQRRHYLDILRARSGREPPPGLDTEWQLLVMGGHGGIGHVDVFADDIVAEAWYRSATALHDAAAMDRDTTRQGGLSANSRSQLWRMLKRNVLDENLDFDPQMVEEALGPTPSVGGMIPKLLVAMAPDAAHPDIHPPGTQHMRDVVLKIEPPEYHGLLDLEALCLAVHREAGFEVPAWHRYDADGLHFLAVERFDQADEKPVPMESLFSVIATGDHLFRETGDLLLEELGDILARLGQVAVLEKDTGELLYRRLLLALLTGNGDLHLDNLALLGGLSGCRLAPVYDPAPMRAWPRHNLVSAIPFDPSGYEDHGAFYVDLGKSFGLPAGRVQQCIRHALDATAAYAERVMEMGRVPLQQRQQLVAIVQQERLLLEKHSH
ncbi:MAG: HipA domain-containing protein [Gammaproteobacteria bacterium]|jgi:serine/threonine-protein kinase HipA